MIGNCNHVQARVVLDMMEYLLNRPYTITVGTMHMQVGLAKLPRMKCLPLGHLRMLLQGYFYYLHQPSTPYIHTLSLHDALPHRSPRRPVRHPGRASHAVEDTSRRAGRAFRAFAVRLRDQCGAPRASRRD